MNSKKGNKNVKGGAENKNYQKPVNEVNIVDELAAEKAARSSRIDRRTKQKRARRGGDGSQSGATLGAERHAQAALMKERMHELNARKAARLAARQSVTMRDVAGRSLGILEIAEYLEPGVPTEVRLYAVQQLAKALKNPKGYLIVLPVFLKLFKDKEGKVRWEALAMLQPNAEPRFALPLLEAFWENWSEFWRRTNFGKEVFKLIGVLRDAKSPEPELPQNAAQHLLRQKMIELARGQEFDRWVQREERAAQKLAKRQAIFAVQEIPAVGATEEEPGKADAALITFLKAVVKPSGERVEYPKPLFEKPEPRHDTHTVVRKSGGGGGGKGRNRRRKEARALRQRAGVMVAYLS